MWCAAGAGCIHHIVRIHQTAPPHRTPHHHCTTTTSHHHTSIPLHTSSSITPLQDGLEGPPEELPAAERALDEVEEDLPIEALMDDDGMYDDEDEDLSLTALLRRRMLADGQHDTAAGGSSSAAAAGPSSSKV